MVAGGADGLVDMVLLATLGFAFVAYLIAWAADFARHPDHDRSDADFFGHDEVR